MTAVSELLEANKELDHENILIIGFNKNGKIHIDTNRATFEFVNYACNRTIFNINNLETSNVLQNGMNEVPQPPQTPAEVAVATQVAEDAAPKKRGRPRKN